MLLLLFRVVCLCFNNLFYFLDMSDKLLVVSIADKSYI